MVEVDKKSRLEQEARKRVLLLDGAMGTMIQQCRLAESDFRGRRFLHAPRQLRGDNDLLCLTRPELISDIHRKYLRAGADIIKTNTFNATSVSQTHYGMERVVGDINRAAVRLARQEADAFSTPGKPRFVAGSVGPTNQSCSISPDVQNPSFRSITFGDLAQAYTEQMVALIEAGVDALLIETVFDTLNAKAALWAAEQAMHAVGKKVALMLSATISGNTGRVLSGQTIDALLASVAHAPLFSIGLNCSFGAQLLLPFLKPLARQASCLVSVHPNAGLPNSLGEYDETPQQFADNMRPFLEQGLVNIAGGCCGTSDAHIAALRPLVEKAMPRKQPQPAPHLCLAGLERLEVRSENHFVNVGERCNVAGSRKFLRLIQEKNYEEALAIARKQVNDGAQIIDINMDDGLLDAAQEMQTFLNLMAADPDIARAPVMLDSSDWRVIETGLKCLQGKSVVNSISLKEGEETFLRRARLIRQYGAAVVVMAFDEQGQATTLQRRKEVCGRAYRLLTEKAGFPPEDIIFDPNILAVGTGIEAHASYAADFIAATAWIRENLPGSHVCGGVSNLSFAFRGNNYIREAMHSVFLYHAIAAGMDMGIVNPGQSVLYADLPPHVLQAIEDVLFNRRADATERLVALATRIKEEAGGGTLRPSGQEQEEAWRTAPVAERLEQALVRGLSQHLEQDLLEALSQYPHAVDIIDGPLMAGMNRVGQLFGEGKMFLPQVVKTARTMKRAVELLQPAIERENTAGGAKAGKVLLATVRGDVHDIGKNIVAVVMGCNGYEVTDLGTMVPPERIVEAARRERPDMVGLSGLITPSLEEMVQVASEMERAGLDIPLLIGGATTSALHTALKIAPAYRAPVVHVQDAAQNPIVAARLTNSERRQMFAEELRREQQTLRDRHAARHTNALSLDEARQRKLNLF